VTVRRLVLATRNEHKVLELRRILGSAGLARVELVGLDAFPDAPDVAESADTFEGNAFLKAEAISLATGLVAIADDSGLAVDALSGMPGIFSARWSGRHGDDEANLRLVLAQLADVPDARRGAAFVCAAVAVSPTGARLAVESQLRGEVIRAPRGEGGFGYDPIFLPTGHDLTTAEMTAEQKDAISHRGIAFRELSVKLATLFSQADTPGTEADQHTSTTFDRGDNR
jgi:XTP/dITP diphosphohydrolase